MTHLIFDLRAIKCEVTHYNFEIIEIIMSEPLELGQPKVI